MQICPLAQMQESVCITGLTKQHSFSILLQKNVAMVFVTQQFQEQHRYKKSLSFIILHFTVIISITKLLKI